MNSEDFEKYLQSINLINDFHPKDTRITRRGFFSIGDGWLQLVHDLINELLSVGWNGRVQQVKEKFGGLRFYIESPTNTQNEIISKYEEIASKTCDVCGLPGTLWRNSRGWYRTVCDKHNIN